MGNLNGAFPLPREDSFPLPASGAEGLPTWAWAIIAAATAVTVIWFIAIFLLVAFEISGKGRSTGRQEKAPTVLTRGGSLSVPPPPVPAPERRTSPSSPPSRSSSIRSAPGVPPIVTSAAEGFRHRLTVPDTDPFEEQEKEFRLSILEPGDDSSSTSTEGSTDDTSKPLGAKPVVSESVREGSQWASPLGATNLSGEEASPTTSLRSSPSLTGMVLSRPVTVRQLGATIREPGYIESEFRKLPNPTVNTDDIPPGAERKNRYSNVLPSPRTRVPLMLQFGRPNSDYINANYIRGYRNHPQQYIATQGPLENTIEDFWRMVWDNNSEVIVMATNFQERGIEKCARYWPAQGSEEYGNLEVTLVTASTLENYVSTVLRLRNLDTREERSLRHFRLTCWPHQGVPKQTKPITDFLSDIKMADSAGPAVVHCSAGIGRTGVLIAVDIGIQGILQEDPKVDILRVVSTLRQDRAGMVQTRDQYRFIHQALYDVAKEVGVHR